MRMRCRARARLLATMAMLAWLAAFVGPTISALAEDVILLSDSLLESEGDADLRLRLRARFSGNRGSAGPRARETREVGYDKGFYLRYSNTRAQSFELKMNWRIQLRHVAFSRDDESWTDQAGITGEIRNRSYFDNERTRLLFWAMLAPKSNTSCSWTVTRMTGTLSTSLTSGGGMSSAKRAKSSSASAKCPRSAIGCCRPSTRDWSIGLWRPTSLPGPDRGAVAGGAADRAVALPVDGRQRLPRTNSPPAELNDRFTFAGTAYWDPLGPNGNGIVDFESTCSPVIRVGHSWTYACQSGLDELGKPLRESDFMRLSDGTRLTHTGALAPGATVNRYDVLLNAVISP